MSFSFARTDLVKAKKRMPSQRTYRPVLSKLVKQSRNFIVESWGGVTQMKVMKIFFSDLDLKVRDTPKLRGAVASKFPGYSLLHHHVEKNRFIYQYPRIQYKIINDRPLIIGIEEGIDVLERIYGQLGELQLGACETELHSEVRIDVVDQLFGDCEDLVEYRFVTPLSLIHI